MERMLRLGDLVDDYCPRERRLTNHAIVAIVEQSIKQTRCTTCDTEHVFKGGKVPPRRGRGAGDKGELVDNSGGQLVAPASAAVEPAETPTAAIAPLAPLAPTAMTAEPSSDPPVTSDQKDPTEVLPDDRANEMAAWAANRTLIRATLPRAENDAPPPRPIPEFTMHRYNARAANGFGRGRGGGGWDRGQGFGGGRGGRQNNGNGNANGNVAGNGNGNGGGNGGFGSGQGHGQGRRRRGKGRPR